MDAMEGQPDLTGLLYAAGTQAATALALQQSLTDPAVDSAASFTPPQGDQEQHNADARALLAAASEIQAQSQVLSQEDGGNGVLDITTSVGGGPSASGTTPGAAVCLDETGQLSEEGEARADFLASASGATSAIDIAAARRLLLRAKQKHVCHICGRECPSKHKLKRHLSTHSEDRPFNCQLCGKNFKWTEYLAKHMRQQHPGVSGPAVEGLEITEESLDSSGAITSPRLTVDSPFAGQSSQELSGDRSVTTSTSTDMSATLEAALDAGNTGGGLALSSGEAFAGAMQSIATGTSDSTLTHSLQLQDASHTSSSSLQPSPPPTITLPSSHLSSSQPSSQQDVSSGASLLHPNSIPPPELIPVQIPQGGQISSETISPAVGGSYPQSQPAHLLASTSSAVQMPSLLSSQTESSSLTAQQQMALQEASSLVQSSPSQTSDLLEQFGIPFSGDTSTSHPLPPLAHSSLPQVQTVQSVPHSEFPNPIDFAAGLASASMSMAPISTGSTMTSFTPAQVDYAMNASGIITTSVPASTHTNGTNGHLMSLQQQMSQMSQMSQAVYEGIDTSQTNMHDVQIAQSEVTVLTDSNTPPEHLLQQLGPALQIATSVAASSGMISVHEDVLSDKDALPPPAKKPKKDMTSVGIQCDVGHETLAALKEEEAQARAQELLAAQQAGLDITATTLAMQEAGSNHVALLQSLAEGAGMSQGDVLNLSDPNIAAGGINNDKVVQKYPCELEGCSKAYIHRKDLIRHMKIRHGISPQKLEPVTMETPEKPFTCDVPGCTRSYFHLKDLRRHQRQCHVVSTSESDGVVEVGEKGMMRIPCDFPGCVRSYVHKKDLVRHKRLYHKDSSSKPSVPDAVRFTESELKRIRQEEKSERNAGNSSFETGRLDSTDSNISISGPEEGAGSVSTAEREQELASFAAQGVSIAVNQAAVNSFQNSNAVAAAESLLSVADSIPSSASNPLALSSSTPLILSRQSRLTTSHSQPPPMQEQETGGMVSSENSGTVVTDPGQPQGMCDVAAYENMRSLINAASGGQNGDDASLGFTFVAQTQDSSAGQVAGDQAHEGASIPYDPATVLNTLPTHTSTEGNTDTSATASVNQLQAQEESLQSVVSSLQLFSSQASAGDLEQGTF